MASPWVREVNENRGRTEMIHVSTYSVKSFAMNSRLSNWSCDQLEQRIFSFRKLLQ